MNRDIDSDTRDRRVASWALLGCALTVAAVTFVLSFHGLDGYGRDVAKVGKTLSWLVPLGVDGLTLTAVAATFLLRHAHLRIRAYAWAVFVIANAASVAGNLSHARSQNLHWDGMVGAATWPLLLALASHLAIVTRRALDRTPTPVVTVVVAPVEQAPVALPAPAISDTASDTASDTDSDTDSDIPSDIPATPVATSAPAQRIRRATPAPTPVATSKAGGNEARAQRMFRAGKNHSDIATTLGVSVKTAERYTAPVRRAADGATPAATPDPGDSDTTDPDRVNGHPTPHLIGVTP